MVGLMGFIVIGIVVALLLFGKTNPIVALVGVPIVGALFLGYTLSDLNDFFNSGLNQVVNVAVMFIFAILFFGVMNHIGLFDPIINNIIKISNGNVILIAIGTVIVGGLAHLDGSGATTFLVTVPAFAPIYKKMKMSPNLLVMLVASSIGIVNLLPWAGPLARAASVLNTDVATLWRPLIPIQVVGFGLLLCFAGIMGWREKKLISSTINTDIDNSSDSFLKKVNHKIKYPLELPKNNANKIVYGINWLVFIGVLVILFSGFLKPALTFLIGLIIVLPLNFRTSKEQAEIIKNNAPNAILMASIIIAAGMFLGVLNGTGMLKEMALSIVSVVPNAVLPFLHIIVGIIGLPLDLITSTDAYYFALLPIVLEIVGPLGVDPSAVVYSMAIGNNFGVMISPLAPATWLGIGLAGISIGSHLRYSFFPMWVFSLLLLVIAYLFGIV